MCILLIKVPIRKKSGNLFNDPRIYIYIYISHSVTCFLLSGICLYLRPSIVNQVDSLYTLWVSVRFEEYFRWYASIYIPVLIKLAMKRVHMFSGENLHKILIKFRYLCIHICFFKIFIFNRWRILQYIENSWE